MYNPQYKVFSTNDSGKLVHQNRPTDLKQMDLI